jgi:hypothetical protein
LEADSLAPDWAYPEETGGMKKNSRSNPAGRSLKGLEADRPCVDCIDKGAVYMTVSDALLGGED